MALPGLALADTPEGRIVGDYSFSFYSEDDIDGGKVVAGGETSRYEIQTHQLHLAAPIADRFDLGIDVMHETMSGASPWYVIPDVDGVTPLQVMTGATISETRTDALLKGSYYLDNGKATLGGGASFENDYLAFNGSLSGERHFNEKNTSVAAGAGFSIDTLEPTDAASDPFRPEKADKQSYSLFAGITQVLGQGSSLQSTLNYQYSTGYLSDPYKRVLVAGTPVGDSRPGARNQFSWLTRYRQHVSFLNASLHADYRFFVDDWEITSHTLELAWYQNLFGFLRVVPTLRYYTQSQADFYAPWFDTAPSSGFASSDYRLSPYGALSYRVRAEALFTTWRLDWRAALSFERYTSSADLAIGKVAVENPGLVSFNVISLNLTTRF